MEFVEQGLAIRQARLARNMTQSHLAALAGVSEKTVRRAEAGDGIRADSVRALCAALDLDASRLRSEAEMRPEDSRRREAVLIRQVWASRATILCLAIGCLLGPVPGLFAGSDWVRQVGIVALMAMSGGALLVIVLGITYLFPRGRLLIGRVPGSARIVEWCDLRRGAAAVVPFVAICTFFLCDLPYVVSRLVANPGFGTGYAVAFDAFLITMIAGHLFWLVNLKGIPLEKGAKPWHPVGTPARA